MLSFHSRASVALFYTVCLWVLAGCGDDDATAPDAGFDASGGSGGTGGSGGVGGDQDAMTSDLDSGSDDSGANIDARVNDAGDAARCEPMTALHASLGGDHVVSNDGVTYNSNPPSSGPHCGSWGQYAVYSEAKPLPRCNYIHNLEHGAVVLLYKCDGACPEIVSALTAVRDAAIDAQCVNAKRVIITPDPDLDTPIAAVAWQNTWTSECTDASVFPSLADFIIDNLGGAGLAPESGVCSNGSVTP